MNRNKFSLSHYRMFSSEMGKLIPIQCVPVIPGDTMQGSNSILIRMAPLNTPVMHPVSVRVDTWFVPNRVIDPNWEKFITGDPNTDVSDLLRVSVGPGEKRLGKFFGINLEGGLVLGHPFYSYNRIYNQRYRDQDLVTEVDESQQDLLNCAWEKDYYTTARPWPAKTGNVSVPIGTSVPTGNSLVIKNNAAGAATAYQMDSTTSPVKVGAATAQNVNMTLDPNDLRLSMALQRFAEARARYGSRFTEYLRYLGITPSDARLQEPELLGSGRGMVNFSEVLQTAPGTGGDGVGDLFGHGIAGLRTRRWRRFFEEHGTILTLLSLRPKSVYDGFTPREWLKEESSDFFQKELVNIGEQPLWASEVSKEGGKFDTWGWVPRYEEYRHHPSQISGEFSTVLNTWTLARQFATPPVLNGSFVTCEPSKRIFQAETNDTVLVMANNNLVARRMLPKSPRPRVM